MIDVTELPIWEDCPFRSKVPERIEIRKGLAWGLPTLVFVLWDKKRNSCRHVDANPEAFLGPHVTQNIECVLNQLGHGKRFQS